jgi:hypothetical protein
VTETAGNGADVRAGSDQLCGTEMAQVMKAHVHPDAFGYPPEGLAETVRFERSRAVGLDAQYVSVGPESHPNLAGSPLHPFPVSDEHSQGEGVKGQATVGVGFRRPDHQLTMIEPILDNPAYPEAARLEVEVAPPQAAELTPRQPVTAARAMATPKTCERLSSAASINFRMVAGLAAAGVRARSGGGLAFSVTAVGTIPQRTAW